MAASQTDHLGDTGASEIADLNSAALLQRLLVSGSSSFNNISIPARPPRKQAVLLLELPDLKASPPTKTTGVR